LALPAQNAEQGLRSGTVSVRLSVPCHSSKPAAAGLLLLARRAGNIARLLHARRSAAAAAGECGQCRVVSVRRKVNTELFLLRPDANDLENVTSFLISRPERNRC